MIFYKVDLLTLHIKSNNFSEMIKLNRIKEVLVEQKRTGKWLSENLGKDMATVSRWCNNHQQPSIDVFERIAELLDVDRRELFNKSK